MPSCSNRQGSGGIGDACDSGHGGGDGGHIGGSGSSYTCSGDTSSCAGGSHCNKCGGESSSNDSAGEGDGSLMRANQPAGLPSTDRCYGPLCDSVSCTRGENGANGNGMQDKPGGGSPVPTSSMGMQDCASAPPAHALRERIGDPQQQNGATMEAALAALYDDSPVMMPNLHVPVCGGLMPPVQAHCMPYCGGHTPDCYLGGATAPSYGVPSAGLGCAGSSTHVQAQMAAHGHYVVDGIGGEGAMYGGTSDDLNDSEGFLTADRPRIVWTNEEDSIILNGVAQMGYKWRRIAAQLPNRSDDAVRNRWHRLEESRRHQEEKIRAAESSGTLETAADGSAALAAPSAPSGYKCSRCGQPKKHHICLAPATMSTIPDAGARAKRPKLACRPDPLRVYSDVEPGSQRLTWTRREDAIILRTVAEIGPKWLDIAAKLPGRTDHAARNRYHRLQRLLPDAGELPAGTQPQASGADSMLPIGWPERVGGQGDHINA